MQSVLCDTIGQDVSRTVTAEFVRHLLNCGGIAIGAIIALVAVWKRYQSLVKENLEVNRRLLAAATKIKPHDDHSSSNDS